MIKSCFDGVLWIKKVFNISDLTFKASQFVVKDYAQMHSFIRLATHKFSNLQNTTGGIQTKLASSLVMGLLESDPNILHSKEFDTGPI